MSCPIGVIEIVLPTANGPAIAIRSMSSFQSGQLATSDQRRQIASGVAAVSMLRSVVHIGRAHFAPRFGCPSIARNTVFVSI